MIKIDSKTILFASYYGFGNIGDEAILAASLDLFRKTQPNLKFIVVSANPAETQGRFQVDAVLWTDISSIIAAVRRSDLVILGGGGIFHDYWGVPADTLLTKDHGGISFYSGIPLLAHMLSKPCMLFAVGIGPLFTEDGRSLTRIALELADRTTVRDFESKDIIQALDISGKHISVTADPAFCLSVEKQKARDALLAAKVDLTEPLIGVCVRNWKIGIDPYHWKKQIAAGLDQFVQTHPEKILFLPFHYGTDDPITNDLEAANDVASMMKSQNRIKILETPYSPEVVAGIIAHCSLVVGMRFHSIIFSVKSGVPVIGLSYDAKVKMLMSRLGLSKYAITLGSISAEKLDSCMVSALAERQQIRSRLIEQSQELGKLAQRNVDIALQMLDTPFSEKQISPSTRLLVNEFSLKQAQPSRQEDTIVERTPPFQAEKTQTEPLTRWQKVLLHLRYSIFPRNSTRERIARMVVHALRDMTPARIIVKVFKKPTIFEDTYSEQDNTQVTLYSDDASLLPAYSPRRPLANLLPDNLQVSLIASVKNEAPNIDEWFHDIFRQTRLPNEIVIVDGGSEDETVPLLEGYRAKSPVPIILIHMHELNIATARNIAVKHSQYPLIAVTDFGCRIQPDWLEKLIQPFKIDPDTKVSAGFYEPINKDHNNSNKFGLRVNLANLDPRKFLPSCRSMAFTKDSFNEVGGQPEWLTMTAEDTYFDLELKHHGGKWAFVPQAVTRWYAPESPRSFFKKLYQWAIGDGESGIHAGCYWTRFLRLLLFLGTALFLLSSLLLVILLRPHPFGLWMSLILIVLLLLMLIPALKYGAAPSAPFYRFIGHIAQVAGFIKGASRRNLVNRRRWEQVKGVYFVLAGVPITDTGGGSRGAQIALELLRQNNCVVYINKFKKNEKKELNLKIAHPNLFLYSLNDFSFNAFMTKNPELLNKKSRAAIVEFPVAEFLPLIREIRQHEGIVLYDLMDDWSTSLGGKWYSANTELSVIRESHLLCASAPALKTYLTQRSGRSVSLVPNAVNDRLFNPKINYPCPADLPEGTRTIIYIGALWGEWFDWELAIRTAEKHPSASLVLIGDYRGQCKKPPGNMHFLGLKAQKDLPAYLAHTDVAIIPWKISTITEATSPLKLYEYLAMHCPVVVPPMRHLLQIPGVAFAHNREEFISLAGMISRNTLDVAAIDRFIQDNNWRTRVMGITDFVTEADQKNKRLQLK